MQTAFVVSPAASEHGLGARATGRRVLLVVLTLAALGFGYAVGPGTGTVEPDLARLLRFMALLKGVFAVAAFGICFWRLARAAPLWREIVYVGGPALMAGGAYCLFQLQSAGIAAIGLHAGLFGLLAAALTDETFFPALRRRAAR